MFNKKNLLYINLIIIIYIAQYSKSPAYKIIRLLEIQIINKDNKKVISYFTFNT